MGEILYLNMIRKKELYEVAKEENEKQSQERELPWPDCYDVSRKIQKRLIEDYGLSSEFVDIEEYRSNDFRHYYLLIQPEVMGDSCVVDASFRQFANDTGTEFDLAGPDDIQDVVIVEPKEGYIFVKT